MTDQERREENARCRAGIAIGVILAVAAVLRFWGLSGGIPVALPWTTVLGPMEMIPLTIHSVPPLGVPEGDAGVVTVLEYRSDMVGFSAGLLGTTRIPLGVDRIAPPAPLDLHASLLRMRGCIPPRLEGLLSWTPNVPLGEQLDHYVVYRDTIPDFEPSESNRVSTVAIDGVGETIEFDWGWIPPEDSLPRRGYHRVIAVDRAGNESEPTEAVYPTAVDEDAFQGLGRGLAIESIAPNPFGTRTQIAYVLPREGEARLAVYDLRGRLVATLLDRIEVAGRHLTWWDGRNDRGERLAAGLYVARLQTAGAEHTRKLVLMR
jgi:hypothetical protein